MSNKASYNFIDYFIGKVYKRKIGRGETNHFLSEDTRGRLAYRVSVSAG